MVGGGGFELLTKFVKFIDDLLSVSDLSFQVGNDFWWDTIKSLGEISTIDTVVTSELEIGNLKSRNHVFKK